MHLIGCLLDKLGMEPEDMRMESSFTNDLGADSLDTVEMLMEAERKYGIRIPDEETSGIATVGDLYQVVLNKIQGNEELAHLLKR